MKKKILACVCILALLVSSLSVSFAEESEKIPAVKLYDEDFKIDGTTLSEYDYTDIALNKTLTLESGIQFTRQQGIITNTEINGNQAIKIGIGDTVGTNNHCIDIPVGKYQTKGEAGKAVIELSVYFDEKANIAESNRYGSRTFYMQFYTSSPSSSRKRALMWDEKLYTEIGEGTDGTAKNEPNKTVGAYDYDAKTWYDVQIVLSWEPNMSDSAKFDYIYDAFVPIKNGRLDPSGEMTKVVSEEKAMHAAGNMSSVRFYSPIENMNSSDVHTGIWAALDNVKVLQERNVPEILSLSCGNSESDMTEVEANGTVNYTASVLAVNMSDYLENAENGDVLLYEKSGSGKTACEILETYYDSENKRIVIKPQNALKPKGKYEIVLTTNVLADKCDIKLLSEQNIEFSVKDSPEITKFFVGTSKDCLQEAEIGGTVNYTATVLAVALSDAIEDVKDGDVFLYEIDGDEKIPCEISQSYDKENKRIVIIPKNALSQNKTHEIVLTENIVISAGGATMPDEQKIDFFVNEEDAVRVMAEDGDFLVGGKTVGNDNSSQERTITFDSGIIASEYSGYMESKEIIEGDARGKSLKIGILGEGTSQPSLNVPVASMQTAGVKGNLELCMDFYINEKTDFVNAGGDSRNGTFRIGFYGAGNRSAVYFDEKMVDNMSSTKYSYDEKSWYKASVYLSWTPNGDYFDYTYDIYVGKYEDGKSVDENMTLVAGNKSIIGENTKISQIRFYIPRVVESEKWIAFDNIKLSETKAIPNITGFGADGKNTGFAVDCDAEIVEIYLDESIKGADESKVKLLQNGVEVRLSDVGYNTENNKILLKIGEKLKENLDYTVELSKDIEVWENIPLGRVRKAEFTTTSNSVSVNNVVITPTDSGAMIDALLNNVSDEEQKVYFIASVWNGNKFVQNKVLIKTVSAGEKENLSIDIPSVDSGNTVKVFAWSGIKNATLVTNGVTSYTK